jgi:hypothetical protein
MNINRQNYEEFFLMYVDNELSEAQRTEVEAFVQQNPDLSEELAMLQESVLLPDEVSFTGKESLYKNENSININNYEEYFLLDVDNELSTEEKGEVEKFVLQHPKLQDEFTLLHQTKLPVEVIEFKDKASLYRKEERERRVIPMRFVRLAIAASVIGLIATLWFVYPDAEKVQDAIAKTENPVSKPNAKTTTTVTDEQPSDNQVAITGETSIEKNVAATKVGGTVKTANASKETIEVAKLPSNRQERDEEHLAYTPQRDIVDTETRTYTTNTAETGLAINASNNNETETSYAQPAVYKEVDEDDDERSILIGSVELNRNKLRGLIKKATTLFDKKARTNDTERTIKIASFEIKTK